MPHWKVEEFVDEAKSLAYEPGCSWLKREIDRYGLHPVVQKALEKYEPKDRKVLMLEWPHVSGDGHRLAYTTSPDKGARDIQTVTSPGKYLRKHFDELADHEVRDLVALGDAGEYNIVRSMERMIEVIENGPPSCMSGDANEFSYTGGAHPYEVYKPKFGWGMALYTNPEGRIDGRAIVLDHDGKKVFVRTYRRCFESNGSQGYSHAHEGLEAWLREKGFEKIGGWPIGAKLALIEAPDDDDIVMPFLDGNNDRVQVFNDHVEISNDGSSATSTSGVMSCYRHHCDHCSRGVRDESDLTYIESESQEVCDSCITSYYTYAYTEGGEQGYVPDTHVRTVDGEKYDDRHFDEYDIVHCAWDNEYHKLENTVTLDGAYVYRRTVNGYLGHHLGSVPEALNLGIELSERVIEEYIEFDPDNARALGLIHDPNQLALPSPFAAVTEPTTAEETQHA